MYFGTGFKSKENVSIRLFILYRVHRSYISVRKKSRPSRLFFICAKVDSYCSLVPPKGSSMSLFFPVPRAKSPSSRIVFTSADLVCLRQVLCEACMTIIRSDKFLSESFAAMPGELQPVLPANFNCKGTCRASPGCHGPGRFNTDPVSQLAAGQHILKDDFCNRTAAGISSAKKKNVDFSLGFSWHIYL